MDKVQITDEQYFQLIENELTGQEAQQLMDLIAQHPHLQEEWAMWQLTVHAPVNEFFDAKELLYKIPEKKSKTPILFWMKVASVAAVLLLGIVIFWDTKPQTTDTAIVNNDNSSTENLIKEIPVQTKENALVTKENREELNIAKVHQEEIKKINPNALEGSEIKKVQIENNRSTSTKFNGENKLDAQITQKQIVKNKAQLPEKPKEPLLPKDTVKAEVPILIAKETPKQDVQIVYGKKTKAKTLQRAIAIRQKVKSEINNYYDEPKLAFGSIIKTSKKIKTQLK